MQKNITFDTESVLLCFDSPFTRCLFLSVLCIQVLFFTYCQFYTFVIHSITFHILCISDIWTTASNTVSVIIISCHSKGQINYYPFPISLSWPGILATY